MNTRLKHIQNWHKLAIEVNWSAAALAKKCNVSLRTLQRYFTSKMGKSPKAWLLEHRQQRAIKLLREGCAVKETANELGYADASSFSREFRKHWNIPPVKANFQFCARKPRIVA